MTALPETAGTATNTCQWKLGLLLPIKVIYLSVVKKKSALVPGETGMGAASFVEGWRPIQ